MNVIQNLKRFIQHPASRAIGLVFFVSSWAFGSWVISIPYVKNNLELDEKVLGLILFGIPLGQIFTNLGASKIIQKFGLYRVCMVNTFLLFIATILPIYAPNQMGLFLTLMFLGINYALLNISMNTIASMISKSLNYEILSSCHGMWSIGGMLGTLFAGIIFSLGIPSKIHILIAMGIALPAAIYAQSYLGTLDILKEQRVKSKSSIAFSPKLLLLIVIGTLVMVAEGFAFDWSAVFLRDYRDASQAYAAFGFSAFMMAMTLGRLLGDTVIGRYSHKLILTLDGVIATTGLLIAVFVPYLWAGYLGLILLGFGVALNAPILYNLSMKLPSIPAEVGLATFATFSFVGFLAGPPLIGWFAQMYGLETSMIGVAAALILGLILSQRV